MEPNSIVTCWNLMWLLFSSFGIHTVIQSWLLCVCNSCVSSCCACWSSTSVWPCHWATSVLEKHCAPTPWKTPTARWLTFPEISIHAALQPGFTSECVFIVYCLLLSCGKSYNPKKFKDVYGSLKNLSALGNYFFCLWNNEFQIIWNPSQFGRH